MKFLLGTLVLCASVCASAKTTIYTKGNSTYAVATSPDGAVTVLAGAAEPCGAGELYPCPGPTVPGDGGVVPPQEPCGNGELYPCPAPGHGNGGGGAVNPPQEPCGNGELYPCAVVSTSRLVVVARYNSAGHMECGAGELYPCQDNAGNERAGGRVAAPTEPCGAGELYPCQTPVGNNRGAGHTVPPRQECGAGELTPCATGAVVKHVDAWLTTQGFAKAE